MQIQVWGVSDPGLKRENNQDSYLIDESLGLFVVADGMGGHKGGEVASLMAVETAREIIAKPQVKELAPRDLLRLIYQEASLRIFERAKVDSSLSGMGTTMVMALLREEVLFIANVGDSRAYLIGETHIWQLTEDHSLINEQIRAGIVSAENAHRVVAKNVITRSVGYEREVVCDIVERDIRPGEIYLLCSDGLHGLVNEKRIVDIVESSEIDNAAQYLIEEAKRNGGDDNITVVLIQVSH
jgi:protein phosphatase